MALLLPINNSVIIDSFYSLLNLSKHSQMQTASYTNEYCTCSRTLLCIMTYCEIHVFHTHTIQAHVWIPHSCVRVRVHIACKAFDVKREYRFTLSMCLNCL